MVIQCSLVQFGSGVEWRGGGDPSILEKIASCKLLMRRIGLHVNMDTYEPSLQLRAVYTLLDIIHLHSDVVADVSSFHNGWASSCLHLSACIWFFTIQQMFVPNIFNYFQPCVVKTTLDEGVTLYGTCIFLVSGDKVHISFFSDLYPWQMISLHS